MKAKQKRADSMDPYCLPFLIVSPCQKGDGIISMIEKRSGKAETDIDPVNQ